MQITAAGLHEIEASEGFSSRPYWDSLGSVWTIGFGETQGISQHTPAISRADAERRLTRRFVQDYAWALQPFVDLVGFTQNMYDALASFIWNCGTGAVSTASAVGRLLRKRSWNAAADALLAWCKAGGKTIQGLLDRRKRERSLFLKRVGHAAVYYLTAWEHKTVEVLQSERATARRHGGWEKVDSSHLRRAARAKADLRARIKLLRSQNLHVLHRAERVAAMRDVIG